MNEGRSEGTADKSSPLVPLESILPGVEFTPPPKRETDSIDPSKTESPMSRALLNMYGHDKNTLEFFREFHDQIVVDLGAGMTRNGYTLASLSGAKAYIGLEPHHAEYLESLFDAASHFLPDKKIPVAVADTDALTFLRALPDHSVSILASGLDSVIIQDDDYARAVAEEILRVTDRKGGYIEFDSVFGDYLYGRTQVLNGTDDPLVRDSLSRPGALNKHILPNIIENVSAAIHKDIENAH